MRQCPRCKSNHVVKNGWRNEKQNYLCRNCRRQFIAAHEPLGYDCSIQRTLYCNGMGFRAIERSTGVCHNTVINWVRQATQQIPDGNYEIPQTSQQTFCYSKSLEMLEASIRLLPYYLKYWSIPDF
jgi:transposase-like protein